MVKKNQNNCYKCIHLYKNDKTIYDNHIYNYYRCNKYNMSITIFLLNDYEPDFCKGCEEDETITR